MDLLGLVILKLSAEAGAGGEVRTRDVLSQPDYKSGPFDR